RQAGAQDGADCRRRAGVNCTLEYLSRSFHGCRRVRRNSRAAHADRIVRASSRAWISPRLDGNRGSVGLRQQPHPAHHSLLLIAHALWIDLTFVWSRSPRPSRRQSRDVLGEKRNNAPDAAAIRAPFLKKTYATWTGSVP